MCELCHNKFGKHSIAIHMKQCIAKREASTAFCPVCDNLVSNDEYEKHVAECKVVNAELLKKKKAEQAAQAKAAAAATPKADGGPLAVTGGTVGRGGAAGAASGGTAAGAAAEEPKRSKVPEHILRKMKEMSEPPETRLLRRLGQPCDACGAVAATVACLGCHAVYCPPCSAGVHEANKALAEHSPVVREDLAAANAAAAASAAAAAGAGEDGRVPCPVCNRKFTSDRIAKHQLVCTKVRNGGQALPHAVASLLPALLASARHFTTTSAAPAPAGATPVHAEHWQEAPQGVPIGGL